MLLRLRALTRTAGAVALIAAFGARSPLLMLNMARRPHAADHCAPAHHAPPHHAPSDRCCDLCALGCVTAVGAPSAALTLASPRVRDLAAGSPPITDGGPEAQYRLPYAVGPPFSRA